MEILTNQNYNFNIWYESFDPIFTEITAKSKIPDKWANYSVVKESTYRDSIIKPINRYVEKLYPAPKLVSIVGNKITLRQHNHAEIFLLESVEGLKALDRPWMRQFYQSKMNFQVQEFCFDQQFVFYVPWFIDEDILVSFSGIDNSPFEVYPINDYYRKIPVEARYIEPMMVPFRFKRTGEHMESDVFGKIKIGSPMFDISFTADDTIIKRIKEFYEYN